MYYKQPLAKPTEKQTFWTHKLMIMDSLFEDNQLQPHRAKMLTQFVDTNKNFSSIHVIIPFFF